MGVSIHVNLNYGCGHYMTSGNHVIGDVGHMSSGRSCDGGCGHYMTSGKSCDRRCKSHDQWEIM